MALCIQCGVAPKALPLHRCEECVESRLPMDQQINLALSRRKLAEQHGLDRARVPREEWPSGRRWCAGCYSFRRYDQPRLRRRLDVSPGHTRCRACEAASRRERVYGVTPEIDEALGTACNICGRQQRFQALAIDHDHATGKIRGKLCLWCNHFIIGPGEISREPLEYFRKVVAYLENPPAQMLTSPQHPVE